jgi:flagellar hook-associated protein 3 FlgL
MSYINSLSQTLFLQNAIKSQNQQLTVLQQIVSSGGRRSDNFSGFTPDVASLGLQLRGELNRNDAYKNTISTMALRTQGIETSLTTVDSEINYLANTITQLNTQDPTGSAVQLTAKSTLEQMISQLNATANGVPLFSGVALNTGGVASYPIVDATTLMNNFRAAVPGLGAATPGGYPFGTVAAVTTPPQDAQTVANNYFATTSNWFVPGAAGVPAAPAQIADDRSIQASVTANPGTPPNNPYGVAIRDALTAVTAISTYKASDFANSKDYTQFLVNQIGQLNTASQEINHAVAINGIVRHQLGDQQTINDTSSNLLQQGLDHAEVDDLSKSITNLNNLQTQLQATYQVTAQLKGLSLANFLPG